MSDETAPPVISGIKVDAPATDTDHDSLDASLVDGNAVLDELPPVLG